MQTKHIIHVALAVFALLAGQQIGAAVYAKVKTTTA